MKPKKYTGKDTGIAMLLTLFALAVISTLALVITAKGHKALEQNRVTLKRAQSLAITEGAIQATYPLLLSKKQDGFLQVRGGKVQHNIRGTNVSVEIYDACGKWDLNVGHISILNALIVHFLPGGAEAFKRELLKARQTNSGFQHINQILALPSSKGLDLSRFINEVTVYCQRPQVDPSNSSDLMREVLRPLPGFLSRPGPGRIFELRATNSLGPGSSISVSTFLNITNDPLDAIKTLNWQSNY